MILSKTFLTLLLYGIIYVQFAIPYFWGRPYAKRTFDWLIKAEWMLPYKQEIAEIYYNSEV